MPGALRNHVSILKVDRVLGMVAKYSVGKQRNVNLNTQELTVGVGRVTLVSMKALGQ